MFYAIIDRDSNGAKIFVKVIGLFRIVKPVARRESDIYLQGHLFIYSHLYLRYSAIPGSGVFPAEFLIGSAYANRSSYGHAPARAGIVEANNAQMAAVAVTAVRFDI